MMEMEEAVSDFDAKLSDLRFDKSAMDVQMKQADLRRVTLSQELLLLKEFEKRELVLEERRNIYVQEERELRVCVFMCVQYVCLSLSICLYLFVFMCLRLFVFVNMCVCVCLLHLYFLLLYSYRPVIYNFVCVYVCLVKAGGV